MQPDVLLLDEPFGALDQRLRQEMQQELKALQRRLELAFLFVTHDQEEALSLSDRIALLHEGRLDRSVLRIKSTTARPLALQPSSWEFQISFRSQTSNRGLLAVAVS